MIEGVCPMLHNRFAQEDHGIGVSKVKKKVYVAEDEAEKAEYRLKDGTIFQPSEHIFAAMTKAAVSFKFEGKKTFKDVVFTNSVLIVLLMNIPVPLLITESLVWTVLLYVSSAKVNWEELFITNKDISTSILSKTRGFVRLAISITLKLVWLVTSFKALSIT